MKAVIVLPGAAGLSAPAGEMDGAYVVAADGGANVLHGWGLRPDLVVGDLDSADEAVLAAFQRDGVRIDRHHARKDQTDAQLALDHALAMGATDVLLVGAAGGRMDHALGNVHLLYRGATRGARVRAIERDARVWTVTPTTPLDLDLPQGALFSVLPLSPNASGIEIEGAVYALKDATMQLGEPYGISNEARAPRQRVACGAGALLVIQPL